MNCKDEINYLDLNDDMKYYEVEIWKNGDSDSRYFRTLRSAKSFYKANAKDESDCIKKHDRGECELIAWKYWEEKLK